MSRRATEQIKATANSLLCLDFMENGCSPLLSNGTDELDSKCKKRNSTQLRAALDDIMDVDLLEINIFELLKLLALPVENQTVRYYQYPTERAKSQFNLKSIGAMIGDHKVCKAGLDKFEYASNA